MYLILIKKYQYNLLLILMVVVVSLMLGCDSDYTQDDSNLNSALSSDTDITPNITPSVSVKSGSFKDSAVAGINYVSGGETGTTDSDGTFKYEEGGTVTFSVGGVVIGSGPPSAEMTPVDIVDGGSEDNQAVVNIARFLQTLDDDGDPTNGIGISSTTSEAIKTTGKSIDFNVDATSFSENTDVLDVVQKVATQTGREVELVSETKAKSHLQNTVMQVKTKKGITTPGIRISKPKEPQQNLEESFRQQPG